MAAPDSRLAALMAKKIPYHKFPPFRSGAALSITAVILAIVLIIVAAVINSWWNFGLVEIYQIKLFSTGIFASFISSAAFFLIFSWGIYWVNKKKPFFLLLTDSDDFVDEQVRVAYERSIKKLAAFNDIYAVELEIRNIDTQKQVCDVFLNVICDIRNLSSLSKYYDTWTIRHLPTVGESREICEIVFTTTAEDYQSLRNAPNMLDEYKAVATPDGGTKCDVPITIAAGGSIWTKTIYRYQWPLRMPDSPLEDCEQHSCSSPRVTKKMELRAKNTSNVDCKIIAVSTSLTSDKSVRVPSGDPNIRTILTVDGLISGGDSGALQIYVEPVMVEPQVG